MITVEEIVALYRRRENDMSAVQEKRKRVRDAYNGELKVEIASMGRAEPAAVANLLNTGLDQLAMRVSSTLPAIHCPPRDEMVKREVTAAEKRKRALYGWWEANDFEVLVPRRARQMLAYAQSPVMLWPDFDRGIPVWRMRDPLGTYPAACMNPGDFTPDDCIFVYTQSYDWLKRRHSEAFGEIKRKTEWRADDKFTLIDYVDADELVTLVLAHQPVDGYGQDAVAYTPAAPGQGVLNGKPYCELVRLPNRAGICTAVVPGRITLDRMLGQFDGMLNLYQRMAHLTALELIAVEKGIFPDTYLIGRDGRQPKFLSGPHDGRTGLINEIMDGDIKEVGTNPGFQTNPTIDRLERGMRLSAGIPAEFGGESASNVRTGRRGDAVLSAAVDFPVQEQQKVLAASMREENKRAIAVSKGYFGNRSQSFYVHWKGARGQVDYKPSDIFTTDHNVVAYSHVGSDLNGLTIMVGQLTGMEVMSKQTAAEMLPIIDNPEQEKDRISAEKLDAALMAGVQQKINAGEMTPADGAWLRAQLVGNKMELFEAILKLDERVQERQARAAEQMADPAQAKPMAGLATGTPAEAQVVPPTIPEGPESQQNLTSILSSLRMGQMRTPAERPAVA